MKRQRGTCVQTGREILNCPRRERVVLSCCWKVRQQFRVAIKLPRVPLTEVHCNSLNLVPVSLSESHFTSAVFHPSQSSNSSSNKETDLSLLSLHGGCEVRKKLFIRVRNEECFPIIFTSNLSLPPVKCISLEQLRNVISCYINWFVFSFLVGWLGTSHEPDRNSIHHLLYSAECLWVFSVFRLGKTLHKTLVKKNKYGQGFHHISIRQMSG